MLVLTRRVGETIVIGENVRVTVLSVRGDHLRLGITAPESVRVDRQEVHERRAGGNADPVPAAAPLHGAARLPGRRPGAVLHAPRG